VIVDAGTGDGRAVLARAVDDPRALVIGVDAAAASMSEASRRADRRGTRNALFLAAGVETLPGSPLAGTADLVTVAYPWGSLLRGVLGLDHSALCGLASVARPGARFDVVVSVVAADRIAGVERLDASCRPAIEAAWGSAGIKLISMREATSADVRATSSSWAHRLGPDRPVWHLEGVRSG
jgi:16S rRNA (adenine(1408)-N(1))-methyltransferase